MMTRVAPRSELGAKPIARIVGHATHAQEPEWFTTAPVGAVAQAARPRPAGRSTDVDLWEVNEAFAVVPMALMNELKLSHDIVNVNGGACALGHPIGATGARIMVTLIHALQARGGSAASPRCASAAARRRRWRSSWCDVSGRVGGAL